MSGQTLTVYLSREAAARFGDSISKRRSVNARLVPANASAVPVAIASVSDNGESAEDFSLQIDSSHGLMNNKDFAGENQGKL